MATAVSPPPQPALKGVQPLRAAEGHTFLLRRMHSLSGLIPVGAFILEHFLSNAEALKGPLAYNAQVKFLNSLPWVPVLEWGFIFLPLMYHALYGLYIWYRGQSNTVVYPWAGNWLYTAQRWTGGIAFLYIMQHLYHLRFTGVRLSEHPGASFAKVQHELSNPWMLAVYIVAIVATSWHFSYGIWLFAAKWGITPGPVARRRFGYVTTMFAIVLMAIGIASAIAFVGPWYKNVPDDSTTTQQTTNSAPSTLTIPTSVASQ